MIQMEQQLVRIRQAYDATVDQYRSGTDWLAQVPEAFKNSSEFQALMQEPCNSNAPENRQYLDPQLGMRFLDVGCCANLANHRLDQWPSTYYGVDISPALIEAMQGFAANHQTPIGGLHVAEVTDLPFDADFFDIADVIGVLEYCTLDYTKRALVELNRVLKPGARMVVDIPNLAHPLVDTMFQLEEHLGRPNVPKPQEAFERLLTPLFAIDRIDDSHVMLKCFVRTINDERKPMSINAETLIRPDIATMDPYTPVYPFEVLAAQLGRAPDEIVKLNANENPYGPPPCVQEALADLKFAHIYPDPESRALREALAAFTGVPAEYLMAGLGADELIDLTMRLFIQPGDAIVNCPPTFGMYPFDADVNSAKCISVERGADFSLDVDGIEAAVAEHQPKLLFVTSPNNPDGSWLSNADLERLLALPLVVALDEAYIEFAGLENSRIKLVPQCENLIVLRSFSKWAGLAGMRVGYAAFPAELMPHLWKIKQPYNVPVASAAAAIAVLNDPDYLEMHVARMITERERLTKLLAEIPYLRPYPSQSTYVLCKVIDRDAHGLKQALEREGILIRYYKTPRLRDHIRISVGRPDQTDVLIDVLKRI